MSTSMLGGPFNAAGDIVQGQMTSQTLDAQAGLADANAQEAENQGQYNATRQSLISSQKIGESEAAYGASGVTSSSGSVADVIGASNANAEMDRLNILHGADIKALNYNNQALMDRYGAASATYGSYWAAAGAITGGAIQGLSSATQGGPSKSGEGSGDEDSDFSSDASDSGVSGEAAGLDAGSSSGAASAVEFA
jgi:hypothetical protein